MKYGFGVVQGYLKWRGSIDRPSLAVSKDLIHERKKEFRGQGQGLARQQHNDQHVSDIATIVLGMYLRKRCGGKGGEALHIVGLLPPSPRLPYMRLADALVSISYTLLSAIC